MTFSSSYAYARLGVETPSRTARPRRLRLFVFGGFFLFVVLSTLYVFDVHLPESTPQVWHGMWDNVYHHRTLHLSPSRRVDS